MTVSSGDQLWRLYSDRSFDMILGPKNVLDELNRLLFFEPLPFVNRVVFLATPHRGSDLSHGVVGRVGAGLINDPDYVAKLLYQLVKDNPDAFDRRRFRRFPSSIETLDPSSPILKSLLAMKPGPGVAYHSIIGSLRPGGVDDSTDGVVPYRSPSRRRRIREGRAFGPRRPERRRGDPGSPPHPARAHRPCGRVRPNRARGHGTALRRGHSYRNCPAARAAAGHAAMNEPGHSLAARGTGC